MCSLTVQMGSYSFSLEVSHNTHHRPLLFLFFLFESTCKKSCATQACFLSSVTYWASSWWTPALKDKNKHISAQAAQPASRIIGLRLFSSNNYWCQLTSCLLLCYQWAEMWSRKFPGALFFHKIFLYRKINNNEWINNNLNFASDLTYAATAEFINWFLF